MSRGIYNLGNNFVRIVKCISVFIVKVSWEGKQLCQNCFGLPSEKGSTLKGNILLPFTLKRKSLLCLRAKANTLVLEWTTFQKGFVCMKSRRKSQKLSPLFKMEENLPCVSSSLNTFIPCCGQVQQMTLMIFFLKLFLRNRI